MQFVVCPLYLNKVVFKSEKKKSENTKELQEKKSFQFLNRIFFFLICERDNSFEIKALLNNKSLAFWEGRVFYFVCFSLKSLILNWESKSFCSLKGYCKSLF